jgi:hypothetical protein
LHGERYVLILTKNLFGLHFGRFFHKPIWSFWLWMLHVVSSFVINYHKILAENKVQKQLFLPTMRISIHAQGDQICLWKSRPKEAQPIFCQT